MDYEPKFKRLRIYNVFMGCLHLAQAAVIIVLSLIAKSLLAWQVFAGTLRPV